MTKASMPMQAQLPPLRYQVRLAIQLRRSPTFTSGMLF